MNWKKVAGGLAMAIFVGVIFFLWASAPIITLTPWFPHVRGISGILSIFWGLLWLPLFGAVLDGAVPGYEPKLGVQGAILGIQTILSLACWGFVIFTRGAIIAFS